MNASKYLKLTAHLMCGATYFLLSLGFHAEALYMVPGIAYGILLAVDLNH